MSGIVGIPCSEQARTTEFWFNICNLELPSGWMILPSRGNSLARDRNEVVRIVLENNLDHIFFLDDDQVFQPDILKKLLAHNLPVVSALYCHRLNPNLPMIYDRYNMDGKLLYRKIKKDESGIIKVAATGGGGLLVKSSVLRKVWEETKGMPFQMGQFSPDDYSEDIYFFGILRKLNIGVFVDLDTTMGHLATMAVWPKRMENGEWITMLNNNGLLIQIPSVDLDESKINKEEFVCVK